MALGTAVTQRSSRALILAALAAWLVSLALPALDITGGPTVSGYQVLTRGWSVWRDGIYAWFANPALIIASALCWLRLRLPALIVAGTGVILALTSWSAPELARAAGLGVPELGFGIGFYLWLASHLLCLVAAGVAIAAARDTTHG